MRNFTILLVAAVLLTACDRDTTSTNPAPGKAGSIPATSPAAFVPEPKFKGRTLSEWVQDTGDKDVQTRRNAYRAVGEMGDRSQAVRSCLQAGVGDSEENVRWDAARSLHKLGIDSQPLVDLTAATINKLPRPVGHPTASATCMLVRDLGTSGKVLLPVLIQMEKEALEASNSSPANGDYESQSRKKDSRSILEELRPLIRQLSHAE